MGTGANDGIKTPARMMDPYAVEIFGFTVLSVALSTICTYLDPRADQVFDGFPRPKFVASIVWQLIVFPATVWLMIRSDQPQGTDEWCICSERAGRYGRYTVLLLPCAHRRATERCCHWASGSVEEQKDVRPPCASRIVLHIRRVAAAWVL